MAGTQGLARTVSPYLVPAGYRAIVKDIVLYVTVATTATVTVYASTAQGSVYLYSASFTAPGFAHQACHQVFMAGETISVAVAGGTAIVGVSGYLLTE